jgi:lysophospholipase L1-like esterase
LNIRSNAAVLALIVCGLTLGCGSGIAPLPPLNIPQTDDVIFTGDSITLLWGEDPGFQTHPNWIAVGINGRTSYALAQSFVTDVISHYPRTVHILVGTNDVYPGWQSCTASSYGLPIPDDTCSNILYMVQTAQHYGIQVVIGTIPPWGCTDNPYCGFASIDESTARYTHITQLNDFLKAFAQQHDITLLDYHTMLQDSTGLHYALNLSVDGVHPAPSGFKVMTPAVAAALK